MNSTSTRHIVSFALCVALSALFFSGCAELGEIDPTQAEVRSLGSCDQVESYVKQQAMQRSDLAIQAENEGSDYDPFGYTNGVAADAVAPGEHSITNNQEAGAHEADIFQVDETHGFALHAGRLIIIEALGDQPGTGGVLQIDDARIVADVELDGTPIEMFLDGNDLVVLSRVRQEHVAKLYEAASTLPGRTDSDTLIQATVFDVTDRHNPKRVRDVSVEGDYVAARRVGNQLYLVARADLGAPKLRSTQTDGSVSSWAEQKAALIDGADLDSWLPYAHTRSYSGQLAARSSKRVDCAHVYTAQSATGDGALGIYSFDITQPLSPVDTTTFIGDGTLVYASTRSIIVANTNFAETTYKRGDTEEIQATSLHRFVMNEDGGTEYSASGIVHGWILNQFSISEHKGFIRVATQMNRETTGYKPINVFTLPVIPQPFDGVLSSDAEGDQPAETRMFLKVAGELVDIAHGEDLFAVRFKGDVGYVVTWQLVKGDPLFTIDLANPENPEIRGELQVPGFSTYLHPIENGRLLAVGKDTDQDSVKVSLYDVSRMSDPNALQEMAVGGSGSNSEALEEHRAFRYVPDHRIMAIPLESGSENSMALFRVDDRSLTEVAEIEHDNAPMRRAYHIGDYLYLQSSRGVSIVNLDDYNTVARVDFD